MTATSDGCASSTHEDKLHAAGRAALAEAIRLFKLDIIDPSVADLASTQRRGHVRAVADRAKIDVILHACGWDWATPYGGNRRGVEWCGLTAGACWRAAGIRADIAKTWFASTYRLAQWAAYRPFDVHANPRPTEGPYRLAVKLTGIRAEDVSAREGDILVVGDGSPEVGDHITIVESYAEGVFATISGNGGGTGPDGKHREGVVRRSFAIDARGYRPLWLYRPAPSDLG